MKFMYASGDQPLDGYTIKRGVGRGGFGEVYFAESDAGKEVAMKLIRRNLDVELRGVRQCLNLKHPNLIALYDIRTDEGGDDWVIMEYVTGPGTGANSLEDVLQQNPTGMAVEDVLRWMRGIAAGVSHLHDNGIVHRDLKPGNIFLDGDTVKIGDYGLSKFISCSRRSGQTESVGTVHYMAPEIANGRYGREIDTYALGIILYEMLTGHVPFEGESVGEVLMKHLTAEPELDKVADPYREIVRRALAKDPEERLRSVGELMAMLPGGDAPNAIAGDAFPAPSPRANAVTNGPAATRHSAATRDAATRDIDEPLYTAITGESRKAWKSLLQTPLIARVMVTFAAGMVALFMGQFLFVLAAAAIAFYTVYYAIWVMVIRPSIPAGAAPSPSIEADTVTLHSRADEPTPRDQRHRMAAQARRMRLNWREAARKQVAAKSQREKSTELIGSMLLAAAICLSGSFLATVLLTGHGSVFSPLHLWLSIVTTLGAWAVLLTNKLTEGRVEDQSPMRVMLLTLGCGVGLLGGYLNYAAGIELPSENGFGPAPSDTLAGGLFNSPNADGLVFTGSTVVGPVAMSVLYFGGLFFLLRWWRQAEYTRDSRISLASLFIVVGSAWLLHLLFWFPQPTGMVVAGLVAIATQLASPWMPPSKREQLARGEAV
ncbi:MAG: serine/threonine-protein kinase [Planctomycetota bacterium]